VDMRIDGGSGILHLYDISNFGYQLPGSERHETQIQTTKWNEAHC